MSSHKHNYLKPFACKIIRIRSFSIMSEKQYLPVISRIWHLAESLRKELRLIDVHCESIMKLRLGTIQPERNRK